MRHFVTFLCAGLLIVGCGDNDSSDGGASANNSANNGSGTNNASNNGGSGSSFMCGDHAAGCMSVTEDVEGFTAKTCVEILDPVPPNYESDCTSIVPTENETVTFLPEGCPESEDLTGSCLTVTTFDFGSTVSSTYHYVSGNDAVDQQIRDSCVSGSTDPSNGGTQASFEKTWCPGLLP